MSPLQKDLYWSKKKIVNKLYIKFNHIKKDDGKKFSMKYECLMQHSIANEWVIDREQSMYHKDAEKLRTVPTFNLEQIRKPLHWII